MNYALILAGGSGSRINSPVPKQFIELDGTPIIVHTLRAFLKYSGNLSIILVLAEAYLSTWDRISREYNFNNSIILRKGGNTRFQSVLSGLAEVKSEGLVAIHDGVRPFVSQDIIHNSFLVAKKHQAAVPVVALKESICSIENNQVKLLDRTTFRLTQTPQTFDNEQIKKAYDIDENPNFTDDATVAQKAGMNISFFEGSYKNIKISTVEDLEIAETFIKMYR